jgi:hypothetical protein
MPQVNGAAQRAQRELFSGFGFGERTNGLTQEFELPFDIAAAVANRQVHAQRDPLAEREIAVFALRQQAGGFLAG